jgi:hypothetical protein
MFPEKSGLQKNFAIGRVKVGPRVGDEGSNGRRDERGLNHQVRPRSRHVRVAVVTAEEQATMESCCHWLTELAEVYARHAGRHGPNRLLPAEVLPARVHVPRHAEPSPQGAAPDGRTAEPSMPKEGFQEHLPENVR